MRLRRWPRGQNRERLPSRHHGNVHLAIVRENQNRLLDQPDRIHWTRASTLFVSSGDQTGKNPRASLWGPLPVWNEKTGRWELFYVGYRSQNQTEPQWLLGYEGRIWRAVSKKKGLSGIGGPYEDVGVILEPGPLSDPWEGLQGTDSDRK